MRQHDRVRIRIGNLSMTSHPIHLHGHELVITGTDGGLVPKTARLPEVTADIAVGQIEFAAAAEGDWALLSGRGISIVPMSAMPRSPITM